MTPHVKKKLKQSDKIVSKGSEPQEKAWMVWGLSYLSYNKNKNK